MWSHHHHHGYRLYSNSLTDFCHQNEANLLRLKEQLIKKDPCYEYGMQHWHPDNRKFKYFQTAHDNLVMNTNSAWENHDVMFTSSAKMRHDTTKQDESDVHLNNDCYLCTTLEEHKRHLLRKGLQLKEKKKPRARVDFVVPLPMNKIKRADPVPDPEEVLYKVTVRTADKSNAGTSAKVYVTLHSGKWSTQKRQLKKKMAWVQFHFGKGTSEVFFIKGPKMGDLKYLTVEHDGIEKKDSWLLKEIEVTNMGESKSWLFPCQQWLSFYEGDLAIKKNLRAVVIEKRLTEYEVTISTGNKRKASTDSNVFITFYGKKGVSPKLKLTPDPTEDCKKPSFQAGQESVCILETEDIGVISRIRIERDKSGSNSGWFVEKVLIRDSSDKVSRFLCYDWLTNKVDKTLHKDLWKTSKKNVKNAQRKIKGKDTVSVKYEVTTVTGNMKYAGTDANIFIKLVGKNISSHELMLSGEGDSLERGRTNTFKIQADDIGSLQKVLVRHDNSGLGAGWFLEKMIIKKYFSEEEINAKMALKEEEPDETWRRKKRAMHDYEKVDNKRLIDSYCSKGKARSRRKHFDSNDDDACQNDDLEESEGEEIMQPRHKPGSRMETRAPANHRQHRGDVYDNGVKKWSKKETFRSKLFQERFRKQEEETDSESEEYDDDMRISKRNLKNIQIDNSDDSDIDEEDLKIRKKIKHISDSEENDSDEEDLDEAENDSRKRSNKGKIPLYDEYVLPCGRWLAKDEDDGAISRVLKVNTITTIFKVGSKKTEH